MTISRAVMAHHRRARWAAELADELDAEIVWDRHNDRIDTGLRSLQAYDPAATHHLVVQDDAIVCRDLIESLELAVKVSEDRIVGLYMGAGQPLSRPRISQIAVAADHANASWITWRGTIWGVAILYPTVHLDALIRSYRRDPTPRYDGRIESCARKRGITWWYTWPSLVDHRDGRENPSIAHPQLSRHAQHRRVAYRFIGADTSALTVDWTAGVHHA